MCSGWFRPVLSSSGSVCWRRSQLQVGNDRIGGKILMSTQVITFVNPFPKAQKDDLFFALRWWRILLYLWWLQSCSINSGLPIITGCWLQEEVIRDHYCCHQQDRCHHYVISVITTIVVITMVNGHLHHRFNRPLFQLELMHSWGLTETHLAKAKHDKLKSKYL